jgi:hypothetical protein
LVYVYNETPADGSYGGVASELIEISSLLYNEANGLISRPVLEDRLTGNQYLLPAEITLVSERDLTVMLASYGISEYRVEDGGRWVLPVSPDEGVGFLNRAWYLTYYDDIQSYLRSAGDTQTEVFSPTDFTVEVVLAAADPSTGRDLTLSLPDTRIGIYYETVTIGSDGSVTVVPPSVVEEQLPVEEPVVSEVVEAEVTEGSETTLVGSSDFDQWYSSNRDAILAVWSNAISGLDLNDSTVDRTAALSQLWNETLRSLYGAELPWGGETVVETDAVLTEDTVRVDETVGDSVVDDITSSQADTVNLGYMSLRPVVYVFNESPADGSVTVVPPSVVEEQLADEEPVVSEVVEAEVLEGSETTLVGSSDFDQWYSDNRDAIIAAWSNAISGLDLNDITVDQTATLSQLWNETLRSLYGAELPSGGETVVENDVVVTEDAVLADETVADSVREEVTTSWTGEEFTEGSATTVTDSRDFQQLYDGDAEAVSEERLIAVNDQMIQGAEQVEEQNDVEQIEITSLSFRPVNTSDRSLSMMTDVDSAMDRIFGFVSFSELPGESDLTGGSSGLSNEIDETSFQGAGDDQIAMSSSVRSRSLIVNGELEVLDEVFENLSFL